MEQAITVLSSKETLSVSQSAMMIAAQYDALRLQTYRDGEGLHSRIQMRSIGSSSLLRFDDVSYFNRVYAGDLSLVSYFDEVEEFYLGCPFACELIFSSAQDAAEFAPICEERGWVGGKAYVWLAAEVDQLVSLPVPDEFVIQRVAAGHEDIFLSTYLAAFEAKKENHGEAMRNMRHLFRHDSLSFLLATADGRPAGVGMTYSDGNGGVFFCAGATLPEYRNRGCHHALLAARLEAARESKCSQVYSWATENGQSQSNMREAGMRVAGTTTSWLYRTA